MYRNPTEAAREASRLVCKFLRGILTPILVQVMKDRKNDSLYALGICHHPHRASPAPDFPERSFYEVGGSQAAPKLRPLDLKEVKQLIEILFQTGHSPWISLPPA